MSSTKIRRNSILANLYIVQNGGRSLWFADGCQLKDLMNEIESFPELCMFFGSYRHHSDIEWIGVSRRDNSQLNDFKNWDKFNLNSRGKFLGYLMPFEEKRQNLKSKDQYCVRWKCDKRELWCEVIDFDNQQFVLEMIAIRLLELRSCVPKELKITARVEKRNYPKNKHLCTID